MKHKKRKYPVLSADTDGYAPTKGMVAAAKRGLELRKKYGKGGAGGRYNSNVLPLSPNALEVTPASLLEAKGNPSSDNENRHGAYGRGNGRSNLNSNFISNTSAVNSGFHLSTSSGVLTDQVVSTEAHLVVSLCVCVL